MCLPRNSVPFIQDNPKTSASKVFAGTAFKQRNSLYNNWGQRLIFRHPLISHSAISHPLCLSASTFFRPSMSLRSSSIRNVHMTIWRPLTGTVTPRPSWVDCVAVRSRSSWSPPATRCTSASFPTPRCKGRASKLHTPQVCVCAGACSSVCVLAIISHLMCACAAVCVWVLVSAKSVTYSHPALISEVWIVFKSNISL